MKDETMSLPEGYNGLRPSADDVLSAPDSKEYGSECQSKP